jgi:hypothetical protein
MFCPQCKAEYRVGFTRCSECGVMLVSRLPAESVEPAKGAELICLRTYPNDAEAVIAKSVLEAAGIDSILRGADRGTDLFVSSEDAEAVLDILG